MNIETEEKLGRGLERICNALLFFVSQRPVDKEALEKKKARQIASRGYVTEEDAEKMKDKALHHYRIPYVLERAKEKYMRLQGYP